MKLENAKPHVIPKDPEKARAERRAKAKAFSDAILFLVGMGFALWWVKSPTTFKHALHYIQGFLT